MTKQSEVVGNPNYVPVLDHGFVGLLDRMGSDADIAKAARVSYGEGTKSVREDRGLIRYLMRKYHTSPFEQSVAKFHIRMPVFIARQFLRHRTGRPNEYSGRYSVYADEFYLPDGSVLMPQSSDNNQGRAGTIDPTSQAGIRWLIEANQQSAYSTYRTLLGEKFDEMPYDPYDEDDPLLTEDYPGLARELARIVLPLSTYTEIYWCQDLHNLMHLLHLRLDGHAQYEIRLYAEAILDLLKPHFPMTFEAFDDYIAKAATVSRMEKDIILELLADKAEAFRALVRDAGGVKEFAATRGMSVREVREFADAWKIDIGA